MNKFTNRFAAVLILLACHVAASGQYVIHIAGDDTANTSGNWGDNGPAIRATLGLPSAMCMDAAGNIYFASLTNNTVRKITASTGIITTLAGGGTSFGEGIAATAAALGAPAGLCLDRLGNLYISDIGNSNIKRVNLSTGLCYTFAGSSTGTPGYSGDGLAANMALLHLPMGLAADTMNNIYVADNENHVIRRITAADGVIRTVAGNGTVGFSGDGGYALAATMNYPAGMYADKMGNFYFADAMNNRIRKVNVQTGIITTVAGSGTGSGSYSGDGGAATAAGLNNPRALIMDNAGNMYIADEFNSRIRRVSTSGIITTYAGNGAYSSPIDSAGDGKPATDAAMLPIALGLDACNNLFFADVYARIRAVVPALPTGKTLCGYYIPEAVEPQPEQAWGIQLYPNPMSSACMMTIADGSNGELPVTITDMSGRTVQMLTIVANRATNVQLHLPSGLYIVTAATSKGPVREKLVIE